VIYCSMSYPDIIIPLRQGSKGYDIGKVQILRSTPVIRYGVYFGNILPSNVPLNVHTSDLIPMARCFFRGLFSIGHVPGPIYEHIFYMTYFSGYPMIIDSKHCVDSFLKHIGDTPISVCDTVTEDIPVVNKHHVKTCLKLGMVIPFHVYADTPTSVRSVNRMVAFHYYIYLPDPGQLLRNAESRRIKMKSSSTSSLVSPVLIISHVAGGKTTLSKQLQAHGYNVLDIDDLEATDKHEFRHNRRTMPIAEYDSWYWKTIKHRFNRLVPKPNVIFAHSRDAAYHLNISHSRVMTYIIRRNVAMAALHARNANRKNPTPDEIFDRSYDSLVKSAGLTVNDKGEFDPAHGNSSNFLRTYVKYDDILHDILEYLKTMHEHETMQPSHPHVILSGYEYYLSHIKQHDLQSRVIQHAALVDRDRNGSAFFGAMRGRSFVFAPSASGKSTIVSDQNYRAFGKDITITQASSMHEPDKTLYLDGDKLVSWKFGDKFWLKADTQLLTHITYTHLSQIVYLTKPLTLRFKHIVIFYNPYNFGAYSDRGILHILPYIPESLCVDNAVRTFGADLSLYAQSNNFGDRVGLTRPAWKQNTKIIPAAVLMDAYGIKYVYDSKDGCISTLYTVNHAGVRTRMSPSGHYFQLLLSFLVPNEHGRHVYIDRFKSLVGMRRNMYSDTYSREPTYTGTAYHSWLDILSAVSSLLFFVKSYHRKFRINKRDAMLCILVMRRIVRQLTVNERTKLCDREELRRKDSRFGFLK